MAHVIRIGGSLRSESSPCKLSFLHSVLDLPSLPYGLSTKLIGALMGLEVESTSRYCNQLRTRSC